MRLQEMKLKADIKDRWVNALRGGNYKQGKGCLLDEYGNYCCLGVLCDLYMKETGEQVTWENQCDGFGDVTQIASFLGYTTILPETIREWAGLNEQSPSVMYTDMDGEGGYRMLSTLNDNHDASFDELAELIEEQL